MKTPIHSLQIGMHWFPERPGGLDRIYHSLVDALPGAGVAVRGTLAGTSRAAAETGGKVEAFAASNERLHRRLLGARRQLSRMLKVDRPDVVASHFALYTLPALDLLRRFPTVIHFHGPWAQEAVLEGGTRMAGELRRKLEGTVYRRGDLHIVLSRAFGQVLETRYGVAPETIRIVPGCVQIDRFAVTASRAEARASFGLPADRPIVLSVRRLAKRMGLEDLIDAVALLRKTQPDVLVAIVGKGALEADLMRRIAELGLAQHVRLLGFVADAQLPLAYRAADLSVVPTVALEGFGLATVESLAAGTPVLVTPVGGLPEAVAGLSADLILSGCGARILADGIDAALRGQLRLPDADACRDYARSHFDLPVIAAQVARVYQEAIERFHRLPA